MDEHRETLTQSNDFAINTDMWKFGGILGRLDFFIVQAKLTALFILAWIPFSVLVIAHNEILTMIGGGVSILLALPVGIYSWANSFKRLRDILGTTENEMLYRVGLFVVMFIPTINIAAIAILFLSPGKITAPEQYKAGQALTRGILKGMTSTLQAITPKDATQDTPTNSTIPKAESTNALETIKTLHELKTAGAITEAEFQEKKSEILKKAA